MLVPGRYEVALLDKKNSVSFPVCFYCFDWTKTVCPALCQALGTQVNESRPQGTPTPGPLVDPRQEKQGLLFLQKGLLALAGGPGAGAGLCLSLPVWREAAGFGASLITWVLSHILPSLRRRLWHFRVCFIDRKECCLTTCKQNWIYYKSKEWWILVFQFSGLLHSREMFPIPTASWCFSVY